MSGSSSHSHGLPPGFPSVVDNELEFSIPDVLSYYQSEPSTRAYLSLRSPSMNSGKFRFRLCVYPNGRYSFNNMQITLGKNLSAFIEADPQESLMPHWSFPNVKYRITVLNWKVFEQSRIKEDSCTFSKDVIDRGWHDLISISELRSRDSEWLGPGGELRLRATAVDNLIEQEWEAMLCPEALASKRLESDFATLLTSGWQSDVVLQAGNEELRVHSLILGARSAVFKQMFSSGMREKATGKVEITDVEPTALKSLCEFAYTGKVSETAWPTEESISALLAAASKYDMPSLRGLCETRAVDKLALENVADWLILASQVNAEALKSACLNFIAGNLAEVQSTQGWSRLMQAKGVLCEVAPLLFQSITPPAKKIKVSSTA